MDRNIGLTADGVADGDAQLFFRPHDVELLDGCGGCIAGTVVASRRSGGKRRVELEVGGARERVEIEIPAEHPAAEKAASLSAHVTGSFFRHPNQLPDRHFTVNGRSVETRGPADAR